MIETNRNFYETLFCIENFPGDKKSTLIREKMGLKFVAAARRLSVMALQRRCFEVFCLSVNLKESVETTEALEQKGAMFNKEDGKVKIPQAVLSRFSLPSLIFWQKIMKEFDASSQQTPVLRSSNWARLLSEGEAMKKASPGDASDLQMLIDLIRYLANEDMCCRVERAISRVSYLLEKVDQSPNDPARSLVQKTVSDFQSRVAFFQIPGVEKLGGFKAVSYLFGRIHKECMPAISEYSRIVVPKLSQEYEALYSFLSLKAKELSLNVSELVSKVLSIRIEGPTVTAWGPEVFRYIERVQLQPLPTPEEFSSPLVPIDLYKTEGSSRETNQSSITESSTSTINSPQMELSSSSSTTSAPMNERKEGVLSFSEKLIQELKGETGAIRPPFALALVPILIQVGQPFMDVKCLSIKYALPGKIIRTFPVPSLKKVVFTVSVDPTSLQIVQMSALETTPLNLVEKYKKEGFFAVQALEVPLMFETNVPPSLPNDGSSISVIKDGFVSVKHPDGTVFNVYPFRGDV